MQTSVKGLISTCVTCVHCGKIFWIASTIICLIHNSGRFSKISCLTQCLWIANLVEWMHSSWQCFDRYGPCPRQTLILLSLLEIQIFFAWIAIIEVFRSDKFDFKAIDLLLGIKLASEELWLRRHIIFCKDIFFQAIISRQKSARMLT